MVSVHTLRGPKHSGSRPWLQLSLSDRRLFKPPRSRCEERANCRGPRRRRPGPPLRVRRQRAEFFGIWIVNILLSLVTFGIYSAWAKVRTKRYFYGNARLDGFGFDYLAKPMQILKGRLVVVLFFVASTVVAQLTPWADLVVGLVVMPVLIPWAVVRALSFSRRYSSYRNVRFGFAGRAMEAFGVYVLLPVAAAISAGLLYPYAAYRRRRFQVEHSTFGRTPFAFDGAADGYFKVYSVALALLLG